MSSGLLSLPGEGTVTDADGADIRNYGNLAGLKSIRKIWAELLNAPVEQVIAENNASLEIMHYVLTFAMLHGLPNSPQPWVQEEDRKWLCPVPGYDRHFAITDTLGFEMIQVPMNEDGPDVDKIQELVANDPSIKGMWLVPTFANPDGTVTSREVAEKLVALEAAAPDFTIMWDNAYCIHTLTEEFPEVYPIIQMAADAGNPNRVFQLTSTSKVTLAGAGFAS